MSFQGCMVSRIFRYVSPRYHLKILRCHRKYSINKGYNTFCKTKYLAFNSKICQFHSSGLLLEKDFVPTDKELAPRKQHFSQIKTKDKNTFLTILKAYVSQDKIRRGHVEFIYVALKYMEEFGVTNDLEAYKMLMDVFPKSKMIPKTLIQAEFFHFARPQQCAIHLLDKMEYNGVCPDKEMKEIILSSFGMSSHVYKKYARMLYWMPKLKNINPYLLPDPLPSDIMELCRLALRKMTVVDSRTKIATYDANDLEDSIDKTWILSAQSPVQQKLIKEHPEEKALYVEGPHLVWMRKLSVTYFILRADAKQYPKIEEDDDDVSNLLLTMFGDPKPVELTLKPSSVHEQEDSTILGICCTGTSSKDSMLSWIRFLRNSNPKLDNIPVLFTLRSSPASVVAVNFSQTSQNENDEETVSQTQNSKS